MRKQFLLSLFPLAIIFAFGYPVMTDPNRKDTDDFGVDSASITATEPAQAIPDNASLSVFSGSVRTFSDLVPGWITLDKILFDGTIL